MPVCEHFEVCGGCTSQDVEYFQELMLKKRQAQYFLWKNDVKTAFQFPRHGNSEGYRTRMDFCFSKEGFCLKKANQWREKVLIKHCNIAHKTIQQYLQRLNEWVLQLPFLQLENTVKYATVRCSIHQENTSITFILNEASAHLDDVKSYIKKLSEQLDENCFVLVGLVPQKSEVSHSRNLEVIKGKEILAETILGNEILFHSQGFFQNNVEVFEKLLSFIEQNLRRHVPNQASAVKGISKKVHANDAAHDGDSLKNLEHSKHNEVDGKLYEEELHSYVFWDLYGGCGSFSVAFSKLFKNIFLVELELLNVEMAVQNASSILANGAAFHIFQGSVLELQSALSESSDEEVFQSYYPAKKDNLNAPIQRATDEIFLKKNVVLVDPPRAGLGSKGIKNVMALQPVILVYVSCNVKKLAEEINVIVSYGYEVVATGLFDFFPRTPHLESVVIFKKTG